MFLLLLFNFALSSVHPCLGAGIDITTLQTSCLAHIYNPTDETTFETNIPESQLVEFNVVMQSSFNIQAYYDQQTDSSGFLGFGTDSSEVYRFYSNYYQEQKSLSKIVLTIAFTEMTSPAIPFPTQQLDPIFMKALKLLPAYDRNHLLPYIEFILTYGMAVIDDITLGGIFESNIWYDNMFNSVYSQEQITESSSWSFAGIIGDGHGSSSDNYFVDKKFNATIVSEYWYVGGNVTMRQDQYLDWAASVESNQQIIKYHLIPITYFIQNKTIAANIAAAIADYELNSSNMLNTYIKNMSKKF